MNNYIIKKSTFILAITFALYSCSDFGDTNVDKINPESVNPEPLYLNATKNLFSQMNGINVNSNVFRLYAQYWTPTTYTDEARYNQSGRDIGGSIWRELYRDVLKDYDEAAVLLQEKFNPNVKSQEQLDNELAQIEIMTVYTYSVLVDVFGDVPYSQALDSENITPVYDDDQEVYYKIIDRLDKAIEMIDTDAAGISSDIVYQSNMNSWLKFANSLKLRMGLRIADFDNDKAKNMVEEAVSSGVFESNMDNAYFPYASDLASANPIWLDLVNSGRNDFLPANTAVDFMNNLDDPRREIWLTTKDGNYVGGEVGQNSPYSNYSHFCCPDGTLFENPALPGTILTYAEVSFLMAEAKARNFSVPGSVSEWYKEGVMASMDEWGVEESEAEDYYDQNEVKYGTANGDWRQKIGVQKWISLFNQGYEGWSTYRKFDFSDIMNPANPPGITVEDIPTRFIYPVYEANRNSQNRSAAASKFDNDSKTAKIFWDVN